MKNPLRNELEELRYQALTSIDPYDIPDTVLLYFKNNATVVKKMSVANVIGDQLGFINQNPTIIVEEGVSTFCLGSAPYIPTVTIDHVPDVIDPVYPRRITFTGTVSRTDTYIPNDILVEYGGVTMRAFLIDDTHWSVTFDLAEVSRETTQLVSARANSIDVNNATQGDYSEFSIPVEELFKIVFNCTAEVDTAACLCLDPSKEYKVSVDDVTYTGTFDEIVDFMTAKKLYAYPSDGQCNPCSGAEPAVLMNLRQTDAFDVTIGDNVYTNLTYAQMISIMNENDVEIVPLYNCDTDTDETFPLRGLNGQDYGYVPLFMTFKTKYPPKEDIYLDSVDIYYTPPEGLMVVTTDFRYLSDMVDSLFRRALSYEDLLENFNINTEWYYEEDDPNCYISSVSPSRNLDVTLSPGSIEFVPTPQDLLDMIDGDAFDAFYFMYNGYPIYKTLSSCYRSVDIQLEVPQ